MIKKYAEIQNEIKGLNVPFSQKLKIGIFAVMLAILCLSGLIALAINMMIFNNLRKLMIFTIGMIIVLIVFLSEYIYLKNIIGDNKINISRIVLADTFVATMVICIVLVVIFFLGVI